MRAVVYHGDCLDVLAGLADEFVDAVVTDPPYEFGFMGRAWDASGIAYNVDLWKHCLRVLKPGGHLLAFGGTRTSHRLTCAIEDAGFEIRDEIAWLYGSGFPKSLDVSKAIDKADKPDDAKRWAGWGTALKPAHEPIVVARKPLAGTVAANVLAHETGALNIDACRVAGEPVPTFDRMAGDRSRADYRTGTGVRDGGSTNIGRWPTNVVLDDVAAVALDEQSQGRMHGAGHARAAIRQAEHPGLFGLAGGDGHRYGDSGGASRFFPVFRYQAKASTRERPKVDGIAHPTVKPLELMRWLVRLVTPADGIVLEPFAGSGTTLEAAVAEGMRCIGIEQSADYLPLIAERMARAGLVVL